MTPLSSAKMACLSLLSAAVVAAAPAQSPSKEMQKEQELLTGFSKATTVRLVEIIDSAATEGLPVHPLVQRALEGQVKGAPDTKIIEVVGRLLDDLQTARKTLGTKTSADELTSAAAALKAGISVDKLMQLQQLRGKQLLTVPLDAWLGLINRGALPDKAWAHIEGLAKRQARDAEFTRLTPADLTRGGPKGGP